MERLRHLPDQPNLDTNRLPEFINPFDFMSSDDARVALELWHRNVPFTYRYFDGDSPTTKMLIPDFAPEFTLSEYKTVIMVEGAFYGSLPGVIDQAALAQVTLEHDGWKAIILFENDVVHNLVAVLNQQFPESVNPVIQGGEKPSPVAPPHWMFTRRQFLRGQALVRTKFTPQKEETNVSRSRTRSIRRAVSERGRNRGTLRSRYSKGLE